MQALIPILLQYALQYGVPAVLDVIAVLKKSDATIADVEAMFAKVKNYDQYGIPEVVLKP